MWKLWRIGKIFGVELKMHGTFVLLLAFYAISGLMAGGVPRAGWNLALGLVIFSVVVLHEFGHIAAARFFGYPPKDIVLTPLGGVARTSGAANGQSFASKPAQEIAIAAAGPAVNLLLAGLTYLVLHFAPWSAFGSGASLATSLTGWFLAINVVLLVFNLIPALPLDGGRILRAILTRKMGYLRATQVAARVARWTTLAMAVYAVATGNFSLLLIAGVIFLASWAEVAQAHVSQARGNPLFQAFQSFGRAGRTAPPSGNTGASVVDQYGNPSGGHPRGGWSSAEHVQPTADGQGWTVQSVRWLGD